MKIKTKYLIGGVAIATLIAILYLSSKDKKKIEFKIETKMADDNQWNKFLVVLADLNGNDSTTYKVLSSEENRAKFKKITSQDAEDIISYFRVIRDPNLSDEQKKKYEVTYQNWLSK